jgi:hypothetical protein
MAKPELKREFCAVFESTMIDAMADVSPVFNVVVWAEAKELLKLCPKEQYIGQTTFGHNFLGILNSVCICGHFLFLLEALRNEIFFAVYIRSRGFFFV